MTTLFASKNGGSSSWANNFDINVVNPNGMTIAAYDFNINTVGTGLGFTFDVYVTAVGGPHVGNTDLPGEWTQISSGTGTGAGQDLPTPVDVTDFLSCARDVWHGLAIYWRRHALYQWDGNQPVF